MKNSSVLIIIPAYNEAENLERVVGELESICPSYDYVIINDGSSDETEQICRRNHYPMLDLPLNLGLAGAFRTGMKYACQNGYEMALQYDGDGQHDPYKIAEMIQRMQEDHADIVIGSRFVEKKKKLTPRTMGNTMISWFIRMTTGVHLTDTTSGMRLYSRRIIRWFASYINFDPEPDTVAYLLRCGARAEEVQVNMRERIAGTSYLKFGSSIKYMVRICSSILLMQWFRRKSKL